MSPVLDSKSLDRIRALQRPGKPDLLARVVSVYLPRSEDLVSAIGQAVEAGDVEAVRQQAHSLKSAAAEVGAREVSERAKQLEFLAREGALDGADKLVAELRQHHEAAEPELRALVADTGDA